MKSLSFVKYKFSLRKLCFLSQLVNIHLLVKLCTSEFLCNLKSWASFEMQFKFCLIGGKSSLYCKKFYENIIKPFPTYTCMILKSFLLSLETPETNRFQKFKTKFNSETERSFSETKISVMLSIIFVNVRKQFLHFINHFSQPSINKNYYFCGRYGFSKKYFHVQQTNVLN